MTEIQAALTALRDPAYAEFQRKLLPTVPPETVIGVRTPALRQMAKEMVKAQAAGFLDTLPHAWFEENQLHAFLICRERDPMRCLAQTEQFLPYIDNWATCDQLSPPCFRRDPSPLLARVEPWLGSGHVYTARFAVGVLMRYYLDDRFLPVYPALAASVHSEEYYLNMMLAWYFATALAKQYDAILPYLTEHRLDLWVHNKTIQKAVESGRLTDAQKAALRALRRRGEKDCKKV